MDETLRNIIQNRAEIKSLLKQIDLPSSSSSIYNNNNSNSNSSSFSSSSFFSSTLNWISPHEKHLLKYNYNKIKDSDEIKNLIQLHSQLFQQNYKLTSKLLVSFDNVDIPDSFPSRPTTSEVRKKIEDGLLNIGVYSTEGYNFGLEYSHIYNGETIPDTRYDDIFAILVRTIRAIDSTIDISTAKQFAEYALRIACWEVEYAKFIVNKTITNKFPELKAQVYEKMNFHTPYIYLGLTEKSTPHFWVRLCPAIESTNNDTSNERDIDKSYEKHTCFCVYHRHDLTVANYEELDIAGFADSMSEESSNNQEKTNPNKSTKGAIPPPPKKMNSTDIRVHLILRNSNNLTNSNNLNIPNPTPPIPERDISVDISNETDNENDVFDDDNNDEDNEDIHHFDNDQVYSNANTPRNSTPSRGVNVSSPIRNQNGNNNNNNNKINLQIQPYLKCDPTPFAECIGWGRNTAYIFDPSNDKLKLNQNQSDNNNSNNSNNNDSNENASDYICYQPTKLRIPPSIHLEKISMIACSHRHMIILTYNGSMYSCGDNTEGALGLGDTLSRPNLTLIIWQQKKQNSETFNITQNLNNTNNDSHDNNNNENDNNSINDDNNSKTSNTTNETNLFDKRLNKNNLIKRIVSIASGSSDIGSHSMAIDEDGVLYGWGTPCATGIGKMEPILTPTIVKMPLLKEPVLTEANIEQQLQQEQEQQQQQQQGGLVTEKIIKVNHVACGGGFTVAVLSTGEVATWGMWAHGRLGLGSPPEAKLNRGARFRRGRFGRDKKKVVRYQLKPKILPQIKNAVKVSCGEAHTLCLTTSGKIFAWGQNSCGQLGIGPTPSGFLRDMLIPTRVHFLQSSDNLKSQLELHQPFQQENLQKEIKMIDICCGTFHSLATDINNNIWSWGGRGDVCLGHNDAQLSGIWADRTQKIFPTLTNSIKHMIPFELIDWCKKWSLPRIIKSLKYDTDHIGFDRAIQLSAGDMHTSVLYQSGRIYLCGNGPVVTPIQMKIEGDDDNNNDDNDNEGEGDDEKFEQKANKVIDEIQKKLVPVTNPRCPSSIWYDKLASRKTKFIVSAGTYTVVIQDEDMIVSNLTNQLLQQTVHPNKTSSSTETGSISTNTTFTSRSRPHLPPIGRGKADCFFIAAGKVLVAHRGLIANRCAYLRERLIEEAPIDDGTPGSIFNPTQVLLPDLNHETANALHLFLYTDTLPSKCVKNISTLRGLQRIAQKMRLPRLMIACDSFIAIHHEISNSLYEEEDDEILDNNEYELLRKKMNEKSIRTIHSVFSDLVLDLPASTLARDFGSLVGDSQYADIRFIAEGRSIAAHRFILEARCEYFRMMFSSGMSESVEILEDTSPMVDIVVPDSFVGLLRFLIYLYTDILPDGSDGAILEDLMSADRYQVPSLKRLCECMLVPSHSNWLDLLRAAHLFNCPQLEASVIGFLRDNISEIMKIESSENLNEEFPTLLSDLMELRRVAYPVPPDQSLIDHTSFVKRKAEEKRNTVHLPWWSIVMAVISIFAYREAITIISLGPLIPVINIAGLLGLVYYFYQTALKE